MAASFPDAIKSFAQQTDGVSTMDAADVNEAYDEIEAIETYIGKRYTVNTTDDTPTVLATLATVSDQVYVITGLLIARRTGGTAGSAGDCALYLVILFYRNIGGVVTDVDGMSEVGAAYEDQEGWGANLSIDGTNIVLTVIGAADNNIAWEWKQNTGLL